MDGENNGNPYQNGWFGGTPIFWKYGNTHLSSRMQCRVQILIMGSHGQIDPRSIIFNDCIPFSTRATCLVPTTLGPPWKGDHGHQLFPPIWSNFVVDSEDFVGFPGISWIHILERIACSFNIPVTWRYPTMTWAVIIFLALCTGDNHENLIVPPQMPPFPSQEIGPSQRVINNHEH